MAAGDRGGCGEGLPLAEVQERFGAWSQGATVEGVEYAMTFPEPGRAALREAVERMLRAIDAPAPPPRT